MDHSAVLKKTIKNVSFEYLFGDNVKKNVQDQNFMENELPKKINEDIISPINSVLSDSEFDIDDEEIKIWVKLLWPQLRKSNGVMRMENVRIQYDFKVPLGASLEWDDNAILLYNFVGRVPYKVDYENIKKYLKALKFFIGYLIEGGYELPLELQELESVLELQELESVIPSQPTMIAYRQIRFNWDQNHIMRYFSFDCQTKYFEQQGRLFNSTHLPYRKELQWIDMMIKFLFLMPSGPYQQFLFKSLKDREFRVQGYVFRLLNRQWTKYRNWPGDESLLFDFMEYWLRSINFLQCGDDGKPAIYIDQKIWLKLRVLESDDKAIESLLLKDVACIKNMLQFPEDEFKFLLNKGSLDQSRINQKDPLPYRTVIGQNPKTHKLAQIIGYNENTAKSLVVKQHVARRVYKKDDQMYYNEQLVYDAKSKPINIRDIVMNPYGYDLNHEIYKLVSGITRVYNTSRYILYVLDIATNIWWRFESTTNEGRPLVWQELYFSNDTNEWLPKVFCVGSFWYPQDLSDGAPQLSDDQADRPSEIPFCLQFYHRDNVVNPILYKFKSELILQTRRYEMKQLDLQRTFYESQKILKPEETATYKKLSVDFIKQIKLNNTQRMRNIRSIKVNVEKFEKQIKKNTKSYLSVFLDLPKQMYSWFVRDAKKQITFKDPDISNNRLITWFPSQYDNGNNTVKEWWVMYQKASESNWDQTWNQLIQSIKQELKNISSPELKTFINLTKILQYKKPFFNRAFVFGACIIQQYKNANMPYAQKLNLGRAISYIKI